MILGACSLQIEKRRYLPGYYVSLTGNNSKGVRSLKGKTVKPLTTPSIKSATCVEIPNTLTKNQLIANSKSDEKAIIANKIEPTTDAARSIKCNSNKSKNNPAVKKSNSLNVNLPSHKEKQHSTDDILFLTLSGLFIAGFAAAFKPFVSKTRVLGYWALNNRKVSRGLHFVAHCGLAASGFYLGQQIYDAGFASSEVTTYTLSGLVAIITAFYPKRKVKSGIFKNTYFKQKMFSMLMVASGLMLFINIGNQFKSKQDSKNTTIIESIITHTPTIDTATSYPSQEEQEEKALKIILTIFAAIISLALCLLIVGGSCALFCSGQGAIGALLLIIGLPTVIILSVEIFKTIWKPKKKVPEVIPG